MNFGLLNFGALKSLGEKDMVKGWWKGCLQLIDNPNQLCELCLVRRSFVKLALRATKSLQLIHMDVWSNQSSFIQQE